MKRPAAFALVVAGTVATSACDQGTFSLGVGPELGDKPVDGAPGGAAPAGGANGAGPATGGTLGSGGFAGQSDRGGGLGRSGAAGAGGLPEAGDSIVQMRVSDVDDFLYATVGGVRRAVWSLEDPRQGQIVDVTHWFAGGTNELRLHGVNTWGPTALHVELWVDGAIVFDESCTTPSCSAEEAGIVYDRTFDVTLPSGPERQPVEVVGFRGGTLYLGVEGQEITATGLTAPATLFLPPGQYTLALGVADDVPFDYTGAYYERVVSVGTAPARVDLTAEPALSVQDTTRIAILPIRQSYDCSGPLGDRCLDPPDGSNIGELLDSDVTQLQAQTQAIGDEWVEPFSYGLVSWQVDVLPTVEDTPFKEKAPDDWDTSCFIATTEAAQLALEQYDMVVFFFPQHKVSGEEVSSASNIAWSLDGRSAFISTLFTRQNEMTDAFGPGAPNPYLVYLLLSNYEAYQRDVRRFYPGLEGISGGRSHGFVDESVNGETGWVAFYRMFLRGQVAELSDMRIGLQPPAVPTSADLYTGIFETVRRGFEAPAFEPPACVPY